MSCMHATWWVIPYSMWLDTALHDFRSLICYVVLKPLRKLQTNPEFTTGKTRFPWGSLPRMRQWSHPQHLLLSISPSQYWGSQSTTHCAHRTVVGKFCRLATLIFGLAWIWWKALHSSQSTWCMCSRASSSPELCTYSADPIDKTAQRNADFQKKQRYVPKSCQGSIKISLVMLALSPATYVKSLSRSASVSSTSERPRKSSLNFSCSSEHFVLQFSIITECHMQNIEHAASTIGETIPIECGELRNSNLCPMSNPKAKSLDWCYHRLNATWRWLDSL